MTTDPEPVLAALADPMRRRLLDRLAAHGSASASTLARELPVTRQAVAQHLAVLDAAGLVTPRRAGREVRYALEPDGLATPARWLADLAGQWERRLAAIRAIAEEDPGVRPPPGT